MLRCFMVTCWVVISVFSDNFASADDQSDPKWIASFLEPEAKDYICANFLRDVRSSTLEIACEHMTIVYNPANASQWEPAYGEEQILEVLAYGADEHAQALMVRVLQGSVVTTNDFAHITLGFSEDPYTAVYSNDLWKRIVHNAPVAVIYDDHDLPKSISLSDRASEWIGILEAESPYEATAAVLVPLPSFTLRSVVCRNDLWDSEKGVCMPL